MKEAMGLLGFLRPAQHRCDSDNFLQSQKSSCEEHVCHVICLLAVTFLADMTVLLADTVCMLPIIKLCIACLLFLRDSKLECSTDLNKAAGESGRSRPHTHSSSSNGSADGHNSLLLPNNAGVQGLLHLDQLLTLITADLLNGDTCSQ